MSLAVRPGEVAVVDGPDLTALLLTLSGRMAVAGGRVKVAGLVLPEQAAAVRRRTAYLDCATAGDLDDELPAVRRARPEIVFVDHADLAPPGTFEGLGTTVVLGVRQRVPLEHEDTRPRLVPLSASR